MPHEAHDHPDGSGTRNGLIVLCGVIFTLILVISFLWLRDYFYLVRNEVVQRKVFEVTNPKLEELRAEEEAILGTYGWVDRDRGIVRIPIERAMELLVQEAAPASAEAPAGDGGSR